MTTIYTDTQSGAIIILCLEGSAVEKIYVSLNTKWCEY